MDIGSNALARALKPSDLALAGARLDQIARIASTISPKALPALAKPPPQPYRELVVKACVDKVLFERHAWSIIGGQVVNDPTLTGEPLGFIYTVGNGERRLAVYFAEPIASA